MAPGTSLLSLPMELRQQIFGHTLDIHSLTALDTSITENRPFEKRYIRQMRALISINRQIRQEMMFVSKEHHKRIEARLHTFEAEMPSVASLIQMYHKLILLQQERISIVHMILHLQREAEGRYEW